MRNISGSLLVPLNTKLIEHIKNKHLPSLKTIKMWDSFSTKSFSTMTRWLKKINFKSWFSDFRGNCCWFSVWCTSFAYEKCFHNIVVHLLVEQLEYILWLYGAKTTSWSDKIISRFLGGGESSNKSVICQLAEERNYLPTPQRSSTLQLVEFTLCRENVMVLVLGYWLILLKRVSYLLL